MRKLLCALILVTVLVALGACAAKDTAENLESEHRSAAESSSGSRESEMPPPQSDPNAARSEIEEGSPVEVASPSMSQAVPSSQHKENPSVEVASPSQATPSSQPGESYAHDEQTLEKMLAHLNESLSDSQQGGIHRISDYNGSGAKYHGGADKADPYILVWVVDKNAVDGALHTYTGQKAEVVCASASYSMEQLKAVKNELENSAVASSIGSVFLGEDNKVGVQVRGKENQEMIDSFLLSYQFANAVTVFKSAEGNENPVT